MPRRARGFTELANGTRISGFLPGTPGFASLKEHGLRGRLAHQTGGIIEATLGYRSRAGVFTDGVVFEVKARHLWRRGARQVLAYSALCGKHSHHCQELGRESR